MLIGYIVVFLILLLTYIVFIGSLGLYSVVTGVIVSTIITAIGAKYLVSNPKKLTELSRLLHLLKYIIVFIRTEIVCHIDVIKRVITGRVTPGIVRVPYDLKSNYAITLTACSITNTPGTVVVDIGEDERAFYVHWIYVKTTKTEEIRKHVSKAYEDCARKIFD